ncbi:GNAT family N-acetyltransferase [Nibrella saemangeumensis]|uniref:GNAT family N-acetyltransferase n=1 Tax=Nibrella saemangeumensis TaxID=1084526 RepID=A0ABP8N783_9BACT
MTHILDNPIWNGLNTGNKLLAYGSENAKYLKRDVGIFAGLKTNSDSDLEDLLAFLPIQSRVVLFSPTDIAIPAGWGMTLKKSIFQMVYQGQPAPLVGDHEVIPLQDKDIPAMLELTALTKPGPFLPRTIEFGNYEGIFCEGELIAMAGQRMQPDPYTEISAVCTHPDHTGKGYAARLIRSQIRSITAAARIPFLHLDLDNTVARTLYEKLGFQTRRQILVYVLEKES